MICLLADWLKVEECSEVLGDAMVVPGECLNGGSWIASLNSCDCPITYGGRLCEVHLCLNGGFLAEDGRSCHCGKFEGKHCEQPACVGGMLNVHGQCISLLLFFDITHLFVVIILSPVLLLYF
ncbi:unnamed protein product [Toxocara canis]|uniref:EGF-like domain-containing protein n=1 Tax=Toxocara canis TaxID=6265 RepID=A0A183U7Y7_TOXCA|nr:unnamed protein product [Toxocara canis]